jgi:hypothetical protein
MLILTRLLEQYVLATVIAKGFADAFRLVCDFLRD